MFRYVVRRLLIIPVILFFVTILIFLWRRSITRRHCIMFSWFTSIMPSIARSTSLALERETCLDRCETVSEEKPTLG